MPADPSELRNQLLHSNQEFRELAAQHYDLDQRLHSLSTKPYLSDSEQVEESQIKKRKLHLKDRMEDILRRHRTASL